MNQPLFLLLVWMGTMSVTAFPLYGWDKAMAKLRRRRIPEAALLGCALLGGGLGALLGMLLFRHKIRKGPGWRSMPPDCHRPCPGPARSAGFRRSGHLFVFSEIFFKLPVDKPVLKRYNSHGYKMVTTVTNFLRRHLWLKNPAP